MIDAVSLICDIIQLHYPITPDMIITVVYYRVIDHPPTLQHR